MSTLKATNIKNESSASNNIVLDSGGGVAVNNGVTLGTGTTISSPASDTFAVSTNGSERIRVDSTGSTLINTTTQTTSNGGLSIATNSSGTSTTPLGLQNRSIGNSSGVYISHRGLTNVGAEADYNYIEMVADNTTSGTGSIRFHTANGSGPVERARIDSSGRLLVGTSSSSANVSAVFRDNSAQNGPAQILLVTSSATPTSAEALARIHFSANNQSFAATIEGSRDGGTWTAGSSQPSKLTFSTTSDGASSPTEKMRIRADGRILTYSPTTDALYVATGQPAGTSNATYVGSHSASGTGTGTASFIVYSNGNVQNTNNSYGQLSDIKLKENIIDADSQWGDIKTIRVRNFNFKEGQTHRQIGVIAQEIEKVSPGLVYESPDRDEEGNDLGTVTKSVNYSVLYMKAVKALQEAMERIETLEAKVAALEAQ